MLKLENPFEIKRISEVFEELIKCKERLDEDDELAINSLWLCEYIDTLTD